MVFEILAFVGQTNYNNYPILSVGELLFYVYNNFVFQHILPTTKGLFGMRGGFLNKSRKQILYQYLTIFYLAV